MAFGHSLEVRLLTVPHGFGELLEQRREQRLLGVTNIRIR